jgi:hypothetical protein
VLSRPHNDGCFGEWLTTGGVLAQFLEEWSQRIQFCTKTGPVTGFQLLDGAIAASGMGSKS